MTKPICFKNEEKEINKDNIWEGDLFSRNKVAEDFTKIITSIEQPFVLSINSNYGSGKTFFLKRWAEELKQNGETVIFFNAWDCDFVEKPLLPFLYNFIEQLKEQGLVQYDLKEDLINCKDVFCTAVKGIIGNYSGINIDDLNEHKNADTLKIPKIKTLEEYKELKKVLFDFKIGLEEIISKLQDKNIYIFVDELERCRPIFAIELLEAIKHLFNVKGLVFILGTDRSQLKHTISNIYGCGMDGEGYLRRFIDLDLELPEPNIKKFTEYLQNNFEINNNEVGAKGNWKIGYDEFNKYFVLFANLYPMHLRDIEHVYAKFNVITKMIDERTNKIMPILALLLISKVKDKTLYDQFNLENLSYEKIDNFLNTKIFDKLNNYKNIDKERLFSNFSYICRIFTRNNYRQILETLYEKYSEPSKVPENVKKEMQLYERVARYQENYDCREDEDSIEYLKKMISYINIE